MKSQVMDKTKWVKVFKASGLDEAGMQRWHEAFERLFPDGHQEFLEWLGIPSKEAAEIRKH